MSRTYFKIVWCSLEREREIVLGWWLCRGCTWRGQACRGRACRGWACRTTLQWCIFYMILHCMTQCPHYEKFYFWVCVWKSESNFVKLVLSLHLYVDSRNELRSSGLYSKHFTYWAISPAQITVESVRRKWGFGDVSSVGTLQQGRHL